MGPRLSLRAPMAVVLLAALVAAGCARSAGDRTPDPSPTPGTSLTAVVGSAAPLDASDPPGPTETLVVAGDIARCESQNDDLTGKLVASLPGAVAVLGDNAYESGTAKELQGCFGPAWGGVMDRIRFAVTGNHDVKTAEGKPMRDYFGASASRDGSTFFSDTLGAWHVVVLDANCGEVAGGCGPDSAQVRWLTADLAANHDRCTLALWHQPRFSSGYHGDAEETGAFWDALYQAGADLVINGHDHDYERFAPQDPAANPDPEHGITELVVGTGGAPLRGFSSEAPNSLVRISKLHGVLSLALAPSGWTSAFMAIDGTAPDRAGGTCH